MDTQYLFKKAPRLPQELVDRLNRKLPIDVQDQILTLRREGVELREIAKRLGLVDWRQAQYICTKAKVLVERTPEELAQTLQSIALRHGGEMLGAFYSTHKKVLWRCKKGHEWEAVPNNVLHNQAWCPSCAHVGPSKAQLEVYDFIRSLVPEEQVLLGDRQVIKPRELDVYVPGRQFGIEYDGLFAHSSYYGQPRGRHLEKAKMCREANVKLLAFFQDEWADPVKRRLLEEMIRVRMGVFVGERLNARELEVRRLSNQDVKGFFAENHLDGHTRCSWACGLFAGERLVMAVSFRNNFAGEFELARMATLVGTNVRGGAGRLLAQVKDRDLITYSNNRLSSGDVYSKLGFEMLAENPPSYWYTDGQTRVWRWKCRHVNEPWEVKNMTEEEQCLAGVQSEEIFGDKRPLYRIEDYGHRKWIRRAQIKLDTPPGRAISSSWRFHRPN